jgi:DNA-binding CsgD family transcriptional regulator
VNSILGQPVSEEFTGFLFAWDEGNPFLTEELLGAIAASGQLQLSQNAWHILPDKRPGLPPSITAAIFERFERLPATDQEVLAYAAVIGRAFDFPLLAALCSIDERELVGVLRRAMHAQLISEVSHIQPSNQAHNEPERYLFRHALTREAIYDQLLAPERRLRHRAVAETLEQLETETLPESATTPATRRDNLAQLLAEHYWLAGLPDKARPYALREAERANQVFAFREERYYLNTAQASLPQDSPERLHLLERMGMLSLGIYDFDDALHWLNLAKAGYQRIGQRHRALLVIANLLFANWFLASSPMPDLLTEVESAAEAVFADPDPASADVETLVAASLLAHYWTLHSLYTRSARWIERCFALFEALDDPRKVPAIQLSHITRAWFKAHQRSNDFEEGRAEIRQALDLASQFSLPDVLMMGYVTFAWMLICWGRTGEAEQVLEEAAELEERSGTLLPSFLLGWQRFFSGDRWEQGMERLRQGIERLDRLHVSYIVAVTRVALAHLLLTRNELAAAEMQLQAAHPALTSHDEYIYHMPLWWGFARLLRVQGDALQAQQWYEHILRSWETTEDTLMIMPVLLDGITFYADSGELVKARQWLSELEAVMQVTDNPVGAAALLEAQGVVNAREGKLEQAIEALRQAVEAWGKLKRDYQQALTCQRLAEVLLTWASTRVVGRAARQAAREKADRLLDQALAVYERLQIPTGIQAVQGLRSSTHLEAQHKRRRTLGARQPVQGLTQRELQVLSQLAAGRTNRELATALSLSVGTVELHVSHILAKLDCETRTQAAAYALAQGWVNKLST